MDVTVKDALAVLMKKSGSTQEFEVAVMEIIAENKALMTRATTTVAEQDRMVRSTFFVLRHVAGQLRFATDEALKHSPEAAEVYA